MLAYGLNMLLHPTEMDVELVEVLKQGAEGGAFSHLGESIDILWKALAAIAVLAIRTRNVSMGIIDITRKQHASMHLAPVGSHLLAVFAASVEISHFISAKHIVHILGEFGLEGCHHGELLANENLGEQIVCAGKDHGLLLEILNVRALSEELGHVVNLVASFTGKPLTGAREDGSTDKNRDVRKFLD